MKKNKTKNGENLKMMPIIANFLIEVEMSGRVIYLVRTKYYSYTQKYKCFPFYKSISKII